MSTQKFYELCDWINLEERKRLGLSLDDLDYKTRRNVKAIFSGEKRPPKKGEWYLSGAIVEAYRAPNDLSESFHIAKLVNTKTETVITMV